MSTKGSGPRQLNRDDKLLAKNWDEVDFKSKDKATKRKEVKRGHKTRITYG
jgi:hypothetical protein